MAAETNLTPLNFNDALTGIVLNDKKSGLAITLGYISGLPPHLAHHSENNGGVGISLMDRGIGQQELDLACQTLCERCMHNDLDILITKSDLPFDARWFMIGSLPTLIEAAQQDRISLPFSDFMYDELLNVLKRYMD